MEEMKREANAGGLEDPGRAAYMIAWRDRHIKKQEELLCAYQEQATLMEALLAFALLKAAAPSEEGMQLRIPKAELREMLDRYVSEVESAETEFVIRFCEKREPSDGGEQQAQ